jgi:DNA-binding beta-propeller fold protein YncE
MIAKRIACDQWVARMSQGWAGRDTGAAPFRARTGRDDDGTHPTVGREPRWRERRLGRRLSRPVASVTRPAEIHVKALALAAVLAAPPAALSPVALPGGAGGIGFDDLRWSSELHALLVPAGRTGRVDLVDPSTRAVASVEGFGTAPRWSGGHEEGTTSADAGGGWIFAIDRSTRSVAVVDPSARRVVARTRLAGDPDYVRWTGAAGEVWVTEPDRGEIETFRLEGGAAPALVRTGSISVPGGPESLVVDPAGRRAYTNTFRDATIAIDVRGRSVAARWRNGCRGARGIDLDAARGVVLVGCSEGKAVSLDASSGAVLGEAATGAGVDGIAFAPALSHLYVPASSAATLTVLGVGDRGALSPLGTVPAAPGSHCAAADDRGGAWVCDPRGGRVLVLHDGYPASR